MSVISFALCGSVRDVIRHSFQLHGQVWLDLQRSGICCFWRWW